MTHRAAVATVLVGLVACGEGSVDVKVDLPDGYNVTRLVVQLVERAAGDTLTCDDIAFRTEAGERVEASAPRRLTWNVKEPRLRLDGVARQSDQLLWAEGRDDTERPLVAGCIRLEHPSPGPEVTLRLAPVVDLALTNRDEIYQGQISPPLPSEVQILAVNALNKGVPGLELRWTTLDPGSAAPKSGPRTRSGTTRTDGAGAAKLNCKALIGSDRLPGPFALEISAPWQRQRLQPIIGFTPAKVTQHRQEGRVPRHFAVGPFGPQGRNAIAMAMVRPTDPPVSEIHLCWFDQQAGKLTCLSQQLQSWPSNIVSLGGRAVLLDSDLKQRIDLVQARIVTAEGTNQLELDRRPIAGSPIVGADAGASLLSVGPCGGSGEAILVRFGELDKLDQPVTGGQQAYRVHDLGGGELVDPLAQKLADQVGTVESQVPLSSGCLEVGKGDTRRTLAVAVINKQTRLRMRNLLLMRSPSGDLETIPLRGSNGHPFSFVPGLGNDPPVLAGNLVHGLAAWLGTFSVARVDSAWRILEAPEVPVYSGVSLVAGGDLDHDGRRDLVTVCAGYVPKLDRFMPAHVVFSYGLTFRGEPLAAADRPVFVDPNQASFAASPQVFVAKIDEDDHDDVIIGDPGAYKEFAQWQHLVVYHMGRRGDPL